MKINNEDEVDQTRTYANEAVYICIYILYIYRYGAFFSLSD